MQQLLAINHALDVCSEHSQYVHVNLNGNIDTGYTYGKHLFREGRECSPSFLFSPPNPEGKSGISQHHEIQSLLWEDALREWDIKLGGHLRKIIPSAILLYGTEVNTDAFGKK